jgi:hypothetical protein
MKTSPTLISVSVSITLAALTAAHPGDCACGYYDQTTGNVFTESIILYFNETERLHATGFETLQYQNLKEKGWNTIYRQASDSSNLRYRNNRYTVRQDGADGTEGSLELWMNKGENHLMNGVELRTIRHDILFGTFRASMRSGRPGAGGSGELAHWHSQRPVPEFSH